MRRSVAMDLLVTEGFQLGFIGAGNMAEAILRCVLNLGKVSPGAVWLSAPSHTRLTPLNTQLGVNVTNDNSEVLRRCHVVLLCVKPHIFPGVAAALQDRDDVTTQLFISVMAGLTLDYLTQALSTVAGSAGVVRCIPNTPCYVGEGACAYALGPNSTALAPTARSLLGLLGLAREVPEGQINAAAALLGSGPAYVYTVLEALADGAVKMGLPRELAGALAAQTVRGAATMAARTGKHPARLRDEVCSPGGTTIAGLHEIERGGVRASFMSAMEAATNRAAELMQANAAKEADDAKAKK